MRLRVGLMGHAEDEREGGEQLGEEDPGAAGGEHARARKADEGIRGKQQSDAAHHGGYQTGIIGQRARGQM